MVDANSTTGIEFENPLFDNNFNDPFARQLDEDENGYNDI